jgi:uncharacterized protein (TIGR02996 family)
MKKRGSEEEGFLASILAKPEDRTSRLVYADWLEERDDPRAQLIRLEEEMRGLPVYSDPYWALKTRRNLLRPECDEDWLEQMRYGTDYEPVFHTVPSGWKERWRLIRAFIERWHKVPLGDVGGQTSRIEITVQTLGYELPPSVREWIALLWDLVDGGGYDQVFRDCLSSEEVPEQDAFSLMIQGEADYHWAVRQQQLSSDDPPVDGYMLDYDNERGGRFIHLDFGV